MSGFSEASRLKAEQQRKKENIDLINRKETEQVIQEFYEDCRRFFTDEKRLPAEIRRRENIVEVKLHGKEAVVRFLQKDFVMTTTRSRPPTRADMDDIPMGPSNAKTALVEFFDV